MITVAGMLAATWLANRKSSRDMAAQWEREDLTRWDEKRLAAYSSYIARVLALRVTIDMLKQSEAAEIIDSFKSAVQERAQVVLLAGAEDISDAATELFDAVRGYALAALQQTGEEKDEEFVNPYVTAVEDKLKTFRILAQRQLGVTVDLEVV